MGESTTKPARFACLTPAALPLSPAVLPCRCRLRCLPLEALPPALYRLPCLPFYGLPPAVILPPSLPLCFPACLPLGFAVLGVRLPIMAP